MRKTKEASGLKLPEQTLVKLSSVNFAPYNPRTMSVEQMAALKASLVKHGMVLNLVVQKRGMVLIGGHQRVDAMRSVCRERNWPEPEAVPAVILDVPDDDAKKLNVALNRIDGEFDPYRLGELFQSLRPDLTEEDVAALGFVMAEVDQAIALVQPPEELAALLEEQAKEDLSIFGRSITLSVEFETVEDRDLAKTLLKELSDKTKPGHILLKALKAEKVTKKRSSSDREKTATNGK